jgi:transcriptional regulator with XRE-family HTH domain
MIDEGPRRCCWCQAVLRRGHYSGALCVSCANPTPLVPQEFFDAPAMRAALEQYDFGPVFRAVRAAAELSQEALGKRIGMSRTEVAMIENGERQVRRANVVVRIANEFGIPAELLGFDLEICTPPEVGGTYSGSFFDALNSALSPDAAATEAPDTEAPEAVLPDSLPDLLPDPHDEPVPSRIGVNDVLGIREVTAMFRAMDFRYGGMAMRAGVMAVVDRVRKMRGSQCTEQVRAELLLATAELSSVAAFMNFDSGLQERTRLLLLIALGSAREARDCNHELANDLMVHIQLQMATQSIHLRQPDEALSFVRLAELTTVIGDYPVSAQARTYVSLKKATCQAMLGKADLCRRALDQAQECVGDIDPSAAPLPWIAHVTPAEITAITGGAMYRLAQHERGYAPKAVEPLLSAIDTFGDEYARSRAMNLPSLAGAYFQVGELDTAIATGHRAVTEINALSSVRILDRLRTLAEVAEPYSYRSDVADLRQHIHRTITMRS